MYSTGRPGDRRARRRNATSVSAHTVKQHTGALRDRLLPAVLLGLNRGSAAYWLGDLGQIAFLSKAQMKIEVLKWPHQVVVQRGTITGESPHVEWGLCPLHQGFCLPISGSECFTSSLMPLALQWLYTLPETSVFTPSPPQCTFREEYTLYISMETPQDSIIITGT